MIMRHTRIALFSGCLLLLQSTQATSPPAQPSASTAQQAAAVRRVQPLSERVANARGSPERQVTPSEFRVQRKGSVLSIRWPSLPHAVPLSAELLRVNAPSPDVTDSKTVMYGKRGVAITGVTPVGSYAVRLQFSDGHDAGIYSYSYLQYLCEHRWSTMKKYIQQLRAQKKSRNPPVRRKSDTASSRRSCHAPKDPSSHASEPPSCSGHGEHPCACK